MLLTNFIKESINLLDNLYPVAEARSIVLILCENILGTKSYTHIVDPQYQIENRKLPLLNAAIDRLRKGEPIQYVTGEAEFADLIFKVTPDVLIPRPETELLCKFVIEAAAREARMRRAYGKNANPVRVLDLCTGSGCIAWKVALSVKGVQIVGVDISDGAIKVASRQDFAQKLRERGSEAPKFVKADVLDTVGIPEMGQFDIIVSNPPYIMESEKPLLRPNVLNFEPESALFVPDDDPLIFYRAIAAWCDKRLIPGGMGFVEINEVLSAETEAVLKDAGFSSVEILKDFYDKNRFISFKKPAAQ